LPDAIRIKPCYRYVGLRHLPAGAAQQH